MPTYVGQHNLAKQLYDCTERGQSRNRTEHINAEYLQGRLVAN